MNATLLFGIPARTQWFRIARLAMASILACAASIVTQAAPPLQVSANGGTTCAVISGAAMCWGYNADGQVGNNSIAQTLAPAQVSGLASGVTAITTGGSHSCAVASGAAWCWGNNAYGQLGDNTGVRRLVPVQVTGLTSGVTAISAGDLHTCAIVNGGVKCWGSNGYGQFGDGTSSFSSMVPVSVVGLTSDVTALSAGREHTCALAAGVAYCWGRGGSGELGSGASPLESRIPVAVSGGDSASVVDAGGSFTCMVKGAAASCWGFGGFGQLGNSGVTGNPLPQPVTGLASGVTGITAGTSYHACAIVNGGLQCWGYNNAGQLGNPSAGGGTSAPTPVSGLGSGVTQVAAGGLHTCAVATGGLYCWGDNPYGELGTGNLNSSNVPVLVVAAPAGGTGLLANPPALGFSPQSMNTTSPPLAVTITNNGASTVSITDVAVPAHFSRANGCAALAPNASCVITVTFTPTASGPISGALTVATAAGTLTVDLAGAGESSLVAHYYRSILRRAPDEGGKAYWSAEAARVAALGANVNETWFAMAMSFYFSPEYQAFNRNPTEFVRDLYSTFFNRAADNGGLDYWTGLLAQGLPREVVLVAFMFSPEFSNFAQAIFGNTSARAEVDTVIDFYRGLLSRLPDSAGFNYWVGQFRAAQCQGAPAIYAQVEAISAAFAEGPEYSARARTNTQYVADLYNAFLRRGGDLGGVQFWIGQLDTAARTRSIERQDFITTPEFSARIQRIIDQGCLN